MTRVKLGGVVAVLALAVGLSGCGSSGQGQLRRPQGIVYSPNGEPLTGGPLGHRPCAQVMDGWFDRLDIGHQGRVTHDQFLADAEAQFVRMDLDHDGYITPEELARFRAPYTDNRQAMVPPSDERPDGGGDAAESRRGRRQEGPSQPSRGTGHASLTQADPVMSADTDLDFRVSHQEFLAQAEAIFKRLDSDHQGTITKPATEASCPKNADGELYR
jgi:hypothetical protein